MLGDKATPADKLYPDAKRLEEKLKDYGLMPESKPVFLQKQTEWAIGKNYGKGLNDLAKGHQENTQQACLIALRIS